MKKLHEVGYDKRPRFGWTDSLDKDPQIVSEEKSTKAYHPVAVIPLPFASPKKRKQIREFTKFLWP